MIPRAPSVGTRRAVARQASVSPHFPIWAIATHSYFLPDFLPVIGAGRCAREELVQVARR